VNYRAALIASLFISTPLIAQAIETVAPQVATETVQQPERKLRLISESAPGYIPRYSDTNGNLTESILLDDGGMLRIFGSVTMPIGGRFYLNYPPTSGSDVTGNLNGVEMLSFGFNSQATYSGTVTQASGRQLYVFDRVASAYRATLDGQGTWWFGTSPTNFGLKVLAPTGSAIGMTIDSAGKVVIGPPIVAPDFVPPVTNAMNVNGDVHVNGTVTGKNIKAHYQDIAEWVLSDTDLAPGTVVVLNLERDNQVMASASAYDTAVAGVVSAQPGMSLGIEGEGKEQIATTGRVKVRVDARSKPIRVGDLLVTSDTPGTAMRSEPMNINGRPFHQPGTIIGKALEPLEGGVGEILVLLSMQ
jgi:hypothetical protein